MDTTDQPTSQTHQSSDNPPPAPQPQPPPPTPTPTSIFNRPSTPPVSNLSPVSATFSYASSEPDIISVEPRAAGAGSPDSRRARARQELNSAFFEELEDVPAQEAQVRRMSVRRMKVPLSGESLRSIAARGRGAGSGGRGSGGRSGGAGRADWQKEQREWEDRAEAVTEGPSLAEEKGLEEGRTTPTGGYGDTSGRNGNNAPGDDRNLSWETGDDVNIVARDGDQAQGKWRKFGNWVLTWQGFLITVYALNVIAWGGMLFLLLINAAPAMCHPSCNHINSARRRWVEYTSQIMNGLFCVTGFGLMPWRFRDLYLLSKYRIRGDTAAWDKLRGVHHSWDKWLPGKPWKVDLVVHLYVANTLLQGVLSGLMWGLTRYNRPAAATGAAVAAACLVAMGAGYIEWKEGRKAKKARTARVNVNDGGESGRVNVNDGGESGRANVNDGGESGRGAPLRMSQISRGTEADRDEEREAKSKEAG